MLDQGSFSEAEAGFRQVLVADPRSVPAYLGLATALNGQGRRDQALALLLERAERWTRSGDYVSAERLWEGALEIAPDSPQALAGLGRTRALDRRLLSAEAPLQQVFDMGRADLRTMLYLGSALWENGKPELAEPVIRRAVEQSNRSIFAVHQLGRLLLWLGRFAEAAALLAECATDPAAGGDVDLDLARALEGAGDLEGALIWYRRAVDALPVHSEARYGLALALQRSGDQAAAQRELEAYERLYQEDQQRIIRERKQQARIDLGRELLRQGRVEEAAEHLESLPESAESLAALAAALRTSGNLEGAVDKLLRAVALAPDREELRALLNEIRLEQLRGR